MSEIERLPDQFVESVNGRICYQELGSGPALILIHGGGPGAYGFSNYRRNIGPLAETNRVIVVDLPGYGGSDSRDMSQGIFSGNALAMIDLMDGLGIEKASMVGNSLGGGTAIKVALDHPDRVEKLILMGPGGSLPSTSTFPSEGLLRMLTFYDGDGPSIEKLDRVLDLLVFDRSTITPELVAERFKTATLPQTMKNPPLKGQAHHPSNDLWRSDIDKLPQPTLLIWGREDRVLPLDMAFILLKRIPKADLHVFSRCGHWAQWERPDEFNRLVLDFLEE